MIRLKSETASISRSGGSPPAAVWEVGDKVESNYKGRGKWYAGKIKRIRLDGSYDIDYDDGEYERAIDADLVRGREESKLSSTSKSRIEVGSKVEANYRGKGKYYPARVNRDRGDGTFDIDYDDGEREMRVPEDMIRLKSETASIANSAIITLESQPTTESVLTILNDGISIAAIEHSGSTQAAEDEIILKQSYHPDSTPFFMINRHPDCVTLLAEPLASGDVEMFVHSQDDFEIGMALRIGMDSTRTEFRTLTGFGSLLVDRGLDYFHPVGTTVEGFKQSLEYPPNDKAANNSESDRLAEGVLEGQYSDAPKKVVEIAMAKSSPVVIEEDSKATIISLELDADRGGFESSGSNHIICGVGCGCCHRVDISS